MEVCKRCKGSGEGESAGRSSKEDRGTSGQPEGHQGDMEKGVHSGYPSRVAVLQASTKSLQAQGLMEPEKIEKDAIRPIPTASYTSPFCLPSFISLLNKPY
jgi:hypothetical protein